MRVLLIMLVISVCCACSKVVVQSREVPRSASGDLPGATNEKYYFMPKCIVRVSVTADKNNTASMLDVNAVYMADASKVYAVKYVKDSFSHDILTIQTNNDGFLEKIESDTSDESGAIIVNTVGNAASLLASIAAGVPAPVKDKKGAKATVETPEPYARDYEVSELMGEGANFSFAGNKYTMKIELSQPAPCWHEVSGTSLNTTTRQVGGLNGNADESVDGVYYKELVPLHLVVECKAKGYKHISTIFVPSCNVSVYHINRATFVQNKSTLSFTNGVPTTITTNKPSEAAQIANLPFDIASKILSIPSSILTIRVQNKTNEASYIKAQQSVIEAQTGLINAIINYKKLNSPAAGQ